MEIFHYSVLLSDMDHPRHIGEEIREDFIRSYSVRHGLLQGLLMLKKVLSYCEIGGLTFEEGRA